MKKILFLGCLCILIAGCKVENVKAVQKKAILNKLPNLVIILSDQHSSDMVGAYGNDEIITPHLDKLAQEGVVLENAYSSQPVCTPFRGMLMSGMHPLKNGAFVNDVPLLPNKTKLLAEILKEQGYQTAYFGKWHLLGGDRDRAIPKELTYGFDKVLTNNCHVDFRPGEAFFWNDKGDKEYFNEWEPYAQTNQAIDYLKNVDPSKPFAIILSLHPPHDWGKFKGEDGKMHYRYDTLDELMDLYQRDAITLRPGLEDTPDRRRMYHGHMAQVTGIDVAVGMLMNQITSMDIDDNTLVAFTADHGDMLESHNADLPKQYPHDYSNKIPFIIKYPTKIKAGTRAKTMLGTMDILPTVLGYMDITTNQKFDGKNLAVNIVENKMNQTDYVPIWNYRIGRAANSSWRGVETARYTYATSKEQNAPLINVLFDRDKDPNQLNNLYDNPDYSAIQKKLQQYTAAWMDIYQDKFYDATDFNAVLPANKWTYNYEFVPLELLKNK